jgi:hypothetical protein
MHPPRSLLRFLPEICGALGGLAMLAIALLLA